MDFKYNISMLSKLENILKSNHYIVRYEKGHFVSGYCLVKEKKIVVVNKFYNIEARINCIIEILEQIDIDIDKFDDDKLTKLYIQLTKKDAIH